jgi:hypothetical protein
MSEDFNYFGVPVENIHAAKQRKHSNKRPRHTVVPTRKEVASLPQTELKPLLINWMENGATEIIPSRGQIAMVKEVLLAREDARDLFPVIAMCTNFIDGA